MKRRTVAPYVINLIILLAVSFSIYSLVYTIPQTPTTYPITPFMSYYTKISYTQKADAAAEAYTAIVIVWVSNVINSTTIEVSERDVQTMTTLGVIPVNFTAEIRRYQVNLITGFANNSYGKFLYWTLPYWNYINVNPTQVTLPVQIGNLTSYITGDENLLVLDLVRNTKVAWYWNMENMSVANYDKYSGALVEYKCRIGNTIEIYQLQSTVGITLGIDLNYYALIVFLFSFVPGLIILLLLVALNIRKKPELAKTRPSERPEQARVKQKIASKKEMQEET